MGDWAPADLLSSFDTDLQTFYYKAIAKELNVSEPAKAAGVKRALREVTNAYRKQTVDSYASSICFDTPEKRCAYVMKHCPCFTSAVARHFSQMLRANPCALPRAVHCRRINLCCLGGGPATDAVGVAKVVNALSNSVLVRSSARLLLNVWVVDLSEEWRTTAAHVLQTLSEDGNFCNPEKMSVDFQFLRADLTEPWEQPLREMLSEADIVTTVYFVSAVNGSKAGNKCPGMLQNIMEALKPGALFFFLDSAKAVHFDTVFTVVSSFRNLRQVYGPCVQSFHTLSMASIRRFIELYFAPFNALLCLTNCFVTCCGWVKEGRHSDCAAGAQGRPYHVGRLWKKMVARNTRRQANFRDRVERLLLSELNMDFATDDLDDSESPSEPERPICDRALVNASKVKRKRIYVWCE